MNALHRALARLAMAATLLSCTAVQAQQPAAEKVLKGKEVTESALIDALQVEGPAGAGATRGFKAAQPGAAPPKPAGPGKANLLVTFGTDSAELTTDAQGVLDTLARAMQSDALAGLSFRVEGHADARGDADRNMKLSQSRAESVARYLSTRHGILAERLQAQGKGSSEPLNKSRVDAPENRRVTIVSQRG